ncbi:MAG: hypothetical protein KJ072_16335 [Verrucomicrobia bacterium]|nr:hypothetical protein [Verrucomicrobiota bacterium]
MEATEILISPQGIQVQPWELLSDEALARLSAEAPPVKVISAPAVRPKTRRRRYGFARALYSGGGGGSMSAPFHLRA